MMRTDARGPEDYDAPLEWRAPSKKTSTIRTDFS